MIKWFLRLIGVLPPVRRRLELKLRSYDQADKLIRSGTGWRIAREEDENGKIGFVWLERGDWEMSALLTAMEKAMTIPVVPDKNAIPPMLHPLGKHWEQPDHKHWLIGDTRVIMPQSDFDKLHDYTQSQPSGVYPGKCWKVQRFIPMRDWQAKRASLENGISAGSVILQILICARTTSAEFSSRDMWVTWVSMRLANSFVKKYGVNCPGCPKIQPKRIPTILLPGQRCKVCGYVDTRPRIKD